MQRSKTKFYFTKHNNILEQLPKYGFDLLGLLKTIIHMDILTSIYIVLIELTCPNPISLDGTFIFFRIF